MRPLHPAMPLALACLVLLAACERYPLSEPPPPQPEFPTQGISSRGPEAGPLSTEAPRILGRGSMAPSVQPTAAPAAPPGSAQRRAPLPSQGGNAPSGAAAPLSSSTPGILWQHTSGARVLWHMNGAVWEGDYTSLPTVDPAWDLAAAADFNADGKPDLLWQHLPTGERAIWFMNGATFEGQFAFLPQVDPMWSIAGAADFNADGKPDILWQHTSGQRAIWFMNGASYEGQYAYLPQVEPVWEIAAVGDFNADGKPDLLWQHLSSGDRAIWLMNGAVWEGAYVLLPVVAPAWDIAGVGDFSADGKLDILWQQTTSGERAIWFMNGAVWEGAFAYLPTIEPAWDIAGVFEMAPPPPGPNEITWRFCAPPDVPIWFAVQDGSGPWTQVAGVPTADGVSFSFSIGERGGVALKKPFIYLELEAPVTIFYGTFAELAALQDVRCAFADRKTLHGSMAGLPQGEGMALSIGAAVYGVEESPFTVENVPDGPQDLLAAVDLVDDLQEYPSHLIIRRGMNLPTNGVVPTLDFSSSEAFAPVLPPVSIAGSDGACLSMWYLMPNSSTTWDPAPIGETNGPFLFFDNCFGGPTMPYVGVPSARQQPGDLHMLHVDDWDTQGTSARSRDVITFFHQAGARTVTLGPPLSTPTVTLVSAAPYLRYRAQLPVQSAYNRVFLASYRSWNPERGVEIMATAAYFGGTVATWDVTIPDLAGAGVNPDWMPRSGDVVEWDVRAAGWSEGSGITLISPVAWLFEPPTDGAAIRFASAGIRPGAASSPRRGIFGGQRR